MSIWICKRPALALASVLLLSGCIGEGTGGGFSLLASAPEKASAKALTRATLVGGSVVAKGPEGYCIDASSLKVGSSGFALVAPCAGLGANASGLSNPALMTIQVQPRVLSRGEINSDGLAEAFRDMQPIYRETGDGLSLVQLAKGGELALPGGEPKHWRAALAFNGYLIGLALYSEAGGIAAREEGKNLLLAFAEEVLSASPIPSAAPKSEPTADASQPKRPKLFGIFFN